MAVGDPPREMSNGRLVVVLLKRSASALPSLTAPPRRRGSALGAGLVEGLVDRRGVERVAAWRANGLTAEAFASGKAFSASTLRWWSSRLGRAQVLP